jgi:hypothetical protein
MHSTTGRGRDCESLDSDVLPNKKSASTRSAISVPQGCGLIRTEFSVGTGALKTLKEAGRDVGKTFVDSGGTVYIWIDDVACTYEEIFRMAEDEKARHG